MAEKNDGGDKTERPTPKRLQDARKKGDVAKSKDVGSTAVLLAWLLVGLMLAGAVFANFAALFDDVFRVMDQPFGDAFEQVAWSAARRFVYLTALLLLPVALFASLMEFLQTGPVFTLEKMTPKLDHLNPGEGLKRMFNTDNLFEVVKSLVKTALLLGLAGLILFGQFDRILRLPAAQPGEVLGAFGAAGFHLLGWTLVVFVFVAILDSAYQRFSFMKRLRMSRRDIRQEAKDMEGDPTVKARRRELAQEWAQSSAVGSVRGAAALVVNPTHIAVSLAYDPGEHVVPVVAGKGDGLIARAMRGMAEREGVPIIRNVPLARALHEQVPVEAVVPEDMFAAVAEVILTARRLRDEAARGETLDPVDLTDEVEGQRADPGEGAAVEAAPVRSGPLFPAMPDDGVASSPETQ